MGRLSDKLQPPSVWAQSLQAPPHPAARRGMGMDRPGVMGVAGVAPYREDAPIVDRMTFLPFGVDATGQTRLAWPGAINSLAESATVPGRLLQGEQMTPDQMQAAAFDLAGIGMSGSLIGAPAGALGSGPVRKGLTEAAGTVGDAASYTGRMISSPAVRIGSQTFKGINHAAALDDAARRLGVSVDDLLRRQDVDFDGFLTDAGQYVDRRTAARIADSAEQTAYDEVIPGRELVAEDLSPDAEFASPATRELMQSRGTVDDVAKGIRAFHGSPHTFDQFDMSKIGTGEGAQAYGHGLYFAESEGVAQSYRDMLAARAPDRSESVGTLAGRAFSDLSIDEKHALRMVRDWGTPQAAADAAARQGLPGREAILRQMAAGELPYTIQTGSMYEVNINANPDDFLDWDKPLSEQPRAVQVAYARAIGNPNPEGIGVDYWLTEQPGQRVYQTIGGEKTSDFLREDVARSAADRLREAGVPGIRYLDAGSRTSGEGSSNYVAFDDKLIQILRRYGLLPPVAAGLGLAGGNEAEAGQ